MPGRSQSRDMEDQGSCGAPGQALPALCHGSLQAPETPETPGHSRVQRGTAWDSGSSLTLGSLSPSPSFYPGFSPAARVSLHRCLEPSSTVWIPAGPCATIHLLIFHPSPQVSPTPISLAASPLTRDSQDTPTFLSLTCAPLTNSISPRALSCALAIRTQPPFWGPRALWRSLRGSAQSRFKPCRDCWRHTHRAALRGPSTV